MNQLHKKDIDTLFEAMLSLNTLEEYHRFFEDICTIKEIQDLSQRLEVAQMLSQGICYATICKETGASTATISRIKRCYDYGTGGYKTVISRLKENNDA